MVKIKESSEFERLELLLTELCRKHELKLHIAGWTRKTFDVFFEEKKHKKTHHIARIESLAANNGEIRFFDDRALDFAQELGEELERGFDVKEAVLIKEKRPEY